MITENVVLKGDIVLFKGKLPINLLIDPIISNTYFIIGFPPLKLLPLMCQA
jgi:hypothetical protein